MEPFIDNKNSRHPSSPGHQSVWNPIEGIEGPFLGSNGMNPLKCFIYYVVKSNYEHCRYPFSTYQTISPMIKRFLKLKKYSIRIKKELK